MTDARTLDIETDDAAPGPRIRWAAIVWGLAFAAIAAAGYAVASSGAATATLAETISHADPGAAVAVVLLILGGLVTVGAIAGLLRGAQRAGERRRMHQSPEESSRQT